MFPPWRSPRSVPKATFPPAYGKKQMLMSRTSLWLRLWGARGAGGPPGPCGEREGGGLMNAQPAGRSQQHRHSWGLAASPRPAEPESAGPGRAEAPTLTGTGITLACVQTALPQAPPFPPGPPGFMAAAPRQAARGAQRALVEQLPEFKSVLG